MAPCNAFRLHGSSSTPSTRRRSTTLRWSSWGRTPTMATGRHTDFASPFRTAYHFRLRSGISFRKYRRKRALPYHKVATSPVGHVRECSCSTPASASVHTRHSAIRARGGRRSPMPSSAPCRARGKGSSSCFGEHLPDARHN